MRHAGERPTTGALAIDGGEYVWMGDGSKRVERYDKDMAG